jgi:hypothetical protein
MRLAMEQPVAGRVLGILALFVLGSSVFFKITAAPLQRRR